MSHATVQMPKSFVFIVTYGRSGSTLLQSILNSVPGYCIRGENANVLLHMVRLWQDLSGNSELAFMRKANRRSTPDYPWYGGECINPDEVARAMVDAFVRTVLCPPEGTRVSGFKEIRWHEDAKLFPDCMRFLHKFFPGAKVILNTRNLDAVTKSGWWANKSPDQVKNWLSFAETLYASYQKEFPDASFHLHYDDYCKSPEALRPLFDFLGEPFDIDRVRAIMAVPLGHAKTMRPTGQE